ncbi:hypothetical protein [Maritalea sp.]|uniref:hypothetical protein n=1 Tax=Maritalea sp. TaxID=2003361 RepID=UPI003EF4C0ED
MCLSVASASASYAGSFEDYQAKATIAVNHYGEPVEEFELQFIDGEEIDCDLAQAWNVNQSNIKAYLDAVENWDEHGQVYFFSRYGKKEFSSS